MKIAILEVAEAEIVVFFQKSSFCTLQNVKYRYKMCFCTLHFCFHVPKGAFVASAGIKIRILVLAEVFLFIHAYIFE